MSSPKKTFKRVIQLIKNLVKDVDDLDERLLNSVCPTPQDLYQTAIALIRYCRKCVRDVNKFRRLYRESTMVRFFDWIWVRVLGIDQIAQHESQLEDCGRAVTLAIWTIKAL
jgi:hypothetical protein